MDGGPGAIRTPDPQIRSLTVGIESKGKFLQPALDRVVPDQWVTKSAQTEIDPENENPGSAATETGAKLHSSDLTSESNLNRRAAAITLADAAADCPPEIRARLLERLLETFRPAWPIPAFMGRVMDEAGFWADMASRAELKAYALACYRRMTPADRIAFIDYLAKGAA